MGLVDITVAHMLSGNPRGGGIAYVGVLSKTNYAYGLSASLGGNLNIDNPSVIRDLIVVSHEIGHNFDASHSQDYCGSGGVSAPVVLCYQSNNGCGSATGLPGVGALSGGNKSDRPATIMSNCHLQNGAMSNLTFTFGHDHLYGVAAGRVPDQMYAHVLESVADFPGCLSVDNTTENTPPAAGFAFSTST